MFQKSVNLLLSRIALDDMVGLLVGPGGVGLGEGTFFDTVVRLFSNDFTPTQDSVDTDFTECTFGGYAGITVAAWIGPVNLGDDAQGLHVEANYEATDAVTPENAFGYFLTDTAGTLIHASERFVTEIPFSIAGDFLSLDVILSQLNTWTPPV